MSAEAERHWFDLAYWQANFPKVRLNAADNEHVEARSLFRQWSSSDAPPIVAVQFTPRELAHAPGPTDTSWIGIVGAAASIIPGVGTVARVVIQATKLGIGIEQGMALQDWAKNHQAAPDDFSPQFAPASFLVPMPLDWAQLAVSHPWYAPALVYEFQQEIQSGDVKTAGEVYAAIKSAMLPPGQADPPAFSRGEAPLFSFLNPTGLVAETGNRRNGETAIAPVVQPSTPGNVPGALSTSSPSGRLAVSPTPFLAAGVLLVLGAPLVLVAAIAGALLVRKPAA